MGVVQDIQFSFQSNERRGRRRKLQARQEAKINGRSQEQNHQARTSGLVHMELKESTICLSLKRGSKCLSWGLELG